MRDSKQQAVQDLGSPRNPALVLYCVTTSSKYSTVQYARMDGVKETNTPT
jgi:hypothetical protein